MNKTNRNSLLFFLAGVTAGVLAVVLTNEDVRNDIVEKKNNALEALQGKRGEIEKNVRKRISETADILSDKLDDLGDNVKDGLAKTKKKIEAE